MLDLSDSLCTYDISLFTRSDFPAFTPRTHRDIPLDIVLTSPSGREFSERVFFPTVTPLRSTVFSEDYLALWRTGCNPVEYGEWTLSVRVKDLEWDPHICGVGLIIEKKR